MPKMSARDVGSAEIGEFVDALYDQVRGSVSPTPLYEITDGERVEVDFLDGRGRLPSENSTEITALDINIASLFFDDFHVLYEGDTGAGKTYGSETLFETVFGDDGFYSIQMKDDMLASTPSDEFTDFDFDEMKVELNEDNLEKYGGMFIDELNRARNVNDVIGLVDGEVSANGDTGELGLPIPGKDGKKGPAIIAAMNPDEAEYSDTTEMDLAGVNRWVKFQYPDNIDESGAGQLKRSEREGLHEAFWNDFTERTSLEGDWRELYPQITDPENMEQDINPRASEFVTTLLGFVGRDPHETVERNKQLISQAGYPLNHDVDEEDNYLQELREAQGDIRGSDSELLSRRDLEQINDTGQILGFIRGIKENGHDGYELGASLTDMVAATGLVAETKRISGTEYGEIIGHVDDAREAYSSVLEGFEEMKDGEFVEGRGVRDTVYQSAVLDGTENGFEAYRSTIQDSIETLNDMTLEDSVEKVVGSRLIADLAVLDHFSEQYSDEVEEVLDNSYEEAVGEFGELVEEVDRSVSDHSAVYDRISFAR